MRRGLPLLAVLLLALAQPAVGAGSWSLASYSWSSGGPGGLVVPGGRGFLTVSLLYSGSDTAENVSICLWLPEGFTLEPGYARCVSAGSVTPGGVAVGEWSILVAPEVEPDRYVASVTVYYSVNGSAGRESFTLLLEVSPAPRPAVSVTEAHWASGGYPGSESRLVIVFENRGPADVAGGVLRLELPDVFEQSTVIIDMPPLPAGGVARVEADTSISASASPGVYRVRWTASLSASYGDAVYPSTVSGYFDVEVSPPPGGVVSLLDYGLAPKEASGPGAGGARLYAVLRVEKPGAVVRAVYAWFNVSKGGLFVNGSSLGLAYSASPVAYGSSVVLESPPLIVEGGVVEFELNVEALVEEGGSTYWVRGSWNLSAAPASEKLVSVRAYWGEGSVYPGSRGRLVVVVENRGPGQVEADIVLRLPEGFEPRVVHVGPVYAAAGAAAESSVEVSVSRSVAPGVYVVECSVEGLVSSGVAASPFNESCILLLRVSPPPWWGLELVYAGWGFGDEAPPRLRGATLVAVLRVAEPGLVIESLRARLVPAPGLLVEGPSTLVVGEARGYGGFYRLEFRGVGVAAEPGSTLRPVLLVEALARLGEAEYWVNMSFPLELRVGEWRPVRLLSARLLPPGAGEAGALGLLLQWLDPRAELSSAVLVVESLEGSELPVKPIGTASGPVGFGGVFQLVARPPLPGAGPVNATLIVSASLPGGGYAVYWERLTLEPERVAAGLVLGGVEARVGGSAAPLLPGQRGVVLVLRLLNLWDSSVSVEVDASASRLPPGFRVLGSTGPCGAAPGSWCSVGLVLDVEPGVKPGLYNVSVAVRYGLQGGGGGRLVFNVSLAVADPAAYAARIEPVSASWRGLPWGYSGSGVASVEVVLLNLGPGAARGVVVEAWSLNSSVPVVSTAAACGAAVEAGGTCTAELLVDLRGARPGRLLLRLRVGQVLASYSSSARAWLEYTLPLRLVEPPLGGGVAVVESGWENGWPAYPGDDARLSLVLLNRWPYPVSGLTATLEAPWGRLGSASLDALQPGGSARVVLRAPLPRGLEPGVYNASLVLRYRLESPGAPVETVERLPVRLEVSDPGEAWRLAQVEWVEQPGAGTGLAVLRLVFRNDGVPTAGPPVLEAVLPDGVYHAATGTRTVLAAPEGYEAPGGLQAAGLQAPATPAASMQAAEVARLLSAASGGAVPRGGMVAFRLELGSAGGWPERLAFNATLVFVDQWGSVVEAVMPVEAPPLGRPWLRLAGMEPWRVRLVNGTATVWLEVENTGDGEAVDVEAVFAPKVPLLVPSEARLRLGRLGPGGELRVPLRLVYNPGGNGLFGGEGPGYGPVAFTVALVYRDRLGHLYIYNTTVSVMLEPLIDVSLAEAKAEARGGSILVGGIVYNRGTETARGVEVRAEAAGAEASTFLGDLEPSGQTAFRLELPATGAGEVRLEIRYRDDYGAEWSRVYTLAVTHERVNATAAAAASPAGEEGAAGVPLAAVAVSVAVFLAASAAMIHRYLSRHSPRGTG